MQYNRNPKKAASLKFIAIRVKAKMVLNGDIIIYGVNTSPSSTASISGPATVTILPGVASVNDFSLNFIHLLNIIPEMALLILSPVVLP